MPPRKQLRRLIADPRYAIVPGAYDALTARLVQNAGFEAVYLTGGGFARASGSPDIGLMTLSEVARFIDTAVEAVDIPVIADADNGYGNAVNVVRTVRTFEKLGVAGLHIEDQVAPKKCGHYEGKAIVAAAEMVGKIKAAVDTRRDQDMVIIARTDARAIEGLEAAIERMIAYLEAGADVAFVEAPRTVDELAAVPGRLGKPAMVNVFKGGKTPALPASRFEAMGYSFGIYANQTHRAAIRATIEVLEVLKKDGDTERFEERMASWEERETAVDTARWNALEAKYLDIP